MKPKPILGLAMIVAIAPLAWAGSQAARQEAAVTGQSHGSSAAHAAETAGRKSALGIRSGTRVSARLLTTLSSKKAKPGQRVVAKVTKNVKQHGHVVIRKNSKLIGHIVAAQASGKGKAGSSLAVTFDHMIQGKTTTALNTVVTAIIPRPRPLTAQPMGMPQPPAAPPMNGGGVGGGGGLVGGAVATAGGTAGSVAGIAGGAGAAAGSTMGSAGRMTSGAGAMMSRNPIVVTTHAAGAGNASAGMSNSLGSAHLGSSAAASNQTATTSVFSRRKGNFQVRSGTQLQFRVVGSAHARKPAPHR